MIALQENLWAEYLGCYYKTHLLRLYICGGTLLRNVNRNDDRDVTEKGLLVT